MAQTAAHLVDHVIPPVPMRQWVISVPKRLRWFLGFRPEAVSALTNIFMSEVERFVCEAAGVKPSGFSIDASVRISLDDRDVPSFYKSLEHLGRYCARPAFAIERLAVIEGRDGKPDRVRYTLARHKRGQWIGPQLLKGTQLFSEVSRRKLICRQQVLPFPRPSGARILIGMRNTLKILLLPLAVASILFVTPATRADVVEIRPVVVREVDPASKAVGIEYRSGDTLVARSTPAAPAGVALKLPGGEWQPVSFHTQAEQGKAIVLCPEKVGPLTFRWSLEQKTPSLVERVLEVTADAKPSGEGTAAAQSQRFTVAFPLDLAIDGSQASFSGPEAGPIVYDAGDRKKKNQTFPVAMLRTADRVFGIAPDSPGLWENRCQVAFDPPARRLEIMTGDGCEPYTMMLAPPEDARDTYQYRMDGWQSIAPGETLRFTTWVFASPARTHYDAQVAAHLAVANAKGWNRSAVEAILRNTSLYLLRRNLARDAADQPRDGRYIFISGLSYGWKQWVTDGFYTAIGLDDPEKTVQSNRAVFWTRIDYEDNAQYYLIWAVLMKRAGGTVNDELVKRAYAFIRTHEKDALYVPPPLPGAPNPKGWKTYHDVLPYDDDDSPASNQGFHCGALLAAKELGLGVTDEEIDRAIAAYRSLFNTKLGFMPTSRKQHDTLGQDTLYGATLTYAVFGKKLLTDEQVLTHFRTSEKVKSPYGLRVISTADGSLLPGHSGVYCYGGSWFLNDAANYLLAEVHGADPAEVDRLLAERIGREIAHVPAFNESISTVNGQPHGNILYSWNSGYWWLRKEIRRRLGQTGPDPVDAAVDAKLGVVRDGGFLRLDPASAKASP